MRGLVPIKPLETALAFLQQQDLAMTSPAVANTPFWVVGSGLAAVETVLALRQRWPERPLKLQAISDRLPAAFQKALHQAGIELVDQDNKQTPRRAKQKRACSAPAARRRHGWLKAD